MVTKELTLEDIAILNQHQNLAGININAMKLAYEQFSRIFTGSQAVPPILTRKLDDADLAARDFICVANKVSTTPMYAGVNATPEVRNLIQSWLDKAQEQVEKVGQYQQLIFELQSNVANAPRNTNGNNNPVIVQGGRKEQKPKELSFDDGPTATKDWIIAMNCYCKGQGQDNDHSILTLFQNVDKTIQSTITAEIGDLSQVMRLPAFTSTDTVTCLADLILNISKQNVDLLQRRLEYTDLEWNKGVKAIDQLNKARTMALDAQLQNYSLEDNLLTKMVSTASATLRNDFLKIPDNDRTLSKFMELARHMEQAASINSVLNNRDTRSLNAVTNYNKNKGFNKSNHSDNRSKHSDNRSNYSDNRSNHSDNRSSDNNTSSSCNNSNSSSSSASKTKTQPNRECKFCGGPEAHNGPDRLKCKALKNVCDLCSNVGHFPQKCLAKSIHSIKVVHDDDSDGSIRLSTTFSKKKMQEDDLPYMDVVLTEKTGQLKHVKALADTGAEDAILHADEAAAAGFHIDKSQRPKIVMPTGDTICADGKVTLNIHYMGIDTTISPWIVPGINQKLYLGQKELKKMGVLPESFPNIIENNVTSETKT